MTKFQKYRFSSAALLTFMHVTPATEIPDERPITAQAPTFRAPNLLPLSLPTQKQSNRHNLLLRLLLDLPTFFPDGFISISTIGFDIALIAILLHPCSGTGSSGTRPDPPRFSPLFYAPATVVITWEARVTPSRV